MGVDLTKRRAVFPGTFDPITNGHLDIIHRGLKIFDELIIAVAESPQKTPLFSIEERLGMIKESIKGLDSVSVESFNNLLIDYLNEKGVKVILRGLRVISDFEYEFQMALTNRKLAPHIETVFMMTGEKYASMSSRFIKEIFRLGGNIECFVPPPVIRGFKDKFGRD